MTKLIVFDAYGTLFDVNAAARDYADIDTAGNFKEIWEKVSTIWRDKQIAYSWYYTSIGYKTNFWKITEDSLDFALAVLNLDKNRDLREGLLSLYQRLSIFPEVMGVLKHVPKNIPTAILSNGTNDMLTKAVSHAGISEYFDAIISAEDLGLFKPHPMVYKKVLTYFKCRPKDVIFVSSNGWDAAGGSAFGFASLWINRTGLPEEKMFWRPSWSGRDLNALLALL